MVQKSKTGQRQGRRLPARRTPPVKRVSKPKRVLTAAALGILKEHLVSPIQSAIMETPVIARQTSSSAVALHEHHHLPAPGPSRFYRPLVPPRTAFWLGVGFGMIVVGGLMVVAWYLMRVELAEEVVVALTRP